MRAREKESVGHLIIDLHLIIALFVCVHAGHIYCVKLEQAVINSLKLFGF